MFVVLFRCPKPIFEQLLQQLKILEKIYNMEHIKKSFTGAHAYQSCTSPNLVFPINVVWRDGRGREVANSSVWIPIPNLHHQRRKTLESLTLNLQMESWAMQNSSKLWKLTYATTTPFLEDWISRVWNAKNNWLLAIDDKNDLDV